MKTIALFFSIILTTFNIYSQEVRIKDLVSIKGVRDNPIIGYGLVIGLNGTGDSGGEITSKSLTKMMQTLGLNPQKELVSQNVAAVIVTAQLPAFARVGQKMDVTISSIGDASSLAGGTLLVTPLKAGDGKIYAIANGSVSIGGIKQGAKQATTARIPNGATVEQELAAVFNDKNSIRLTTHQSDFTTTARIEKIINQNLGGKFALAKDSATIDLIIPNQYQKRVVELIAIIENFKVITDQKAKIVINERTGTIVAGGDILLKKVAIGHGDLVLEVKNDAGQNKKESMHLVEQSTSINDLVKALNTIGTKPEDIISIFQALKQNGALIADIELI
jgi:flagellar P-ring protein precursor FlgI